MTATPTPRDRQFARALCGRADQRASGILTAARGKLRRIFCLQKGDIVFATSNLLEEQYIEYLVRAGVLSPRLRAEAVDEAARAHVKLIPYLLKLGFPAPAELRRGMEGLVRELATSTLEWPEGQFQFEEGLPRLDDEIQVRLAPRALVIAHAKRYPAAIDALRIRIGPPDFRPVAAGPQAGKPGTGVDELGEYLLERCDGTAELAEIVKESPAPEEATLRAIYGFLLAGLIDPEDREARRAREASLNEDELSREECLGRLAMAAGQDHYGVLGVDRTARIKAIRDAYYAMARRYHPDRFRSGPLADLLPKFEVFFMQVTDAHNTLADPMRRSEYDEQIASATSAAESGKDADTGYLAKQNFLRGRALVSQRKYTEAVTFFENAISLDPGQADYHLELGLTLSLNPRHREAAERHLLRAIDLAPTLVEAYVALGQMYLKAGRMGRAGRMAREAMRWEPGHLEASELLAAAGGTSDERDDIRQGVFGSS